MNDCDFSTVRALAHERGFALVGVTAAAPSAYGAYLRRWLDEGKHGEMAYLAEHLAKRLDPRVLLDGARSVICVADRYPAGVPGGSRNTASRPGRQAVGRIARYAWGNDYHRVIKKRLFGLADSLRDRWPDHQHKVAVDTAPLLEREHAQRAGLGWVGKHTLLIHPRNGSWLLLGQIVTTLAVRGDPTPPPPVVDHCGTCTRCIDACPTDCLSPYQLDAQRCISYLTIEHRGPIEPQQHESMGDWIAGCDVCQEVCPYNQPERIERFDRSTPPPAGPLFQDAYAVRPPAPAASLMAVLNWDQASRRVALRSSALKRISLEMFKRNALIAAGNHLMRRGDEALRRRIVELSADEQEAPLVRRTAQQVLERLSSRTAGTR